jgi:hypothetical protein
MAKTAEERNARRRELNATEERKAKRREYNSTPHAKALKKEQKKRYTEKNREKVNEAKKRYKANNPLIADKLKQAHKEYLQTPHGKEIKRKQKQRQRTKLALWYVRKVMIGNTCLKPSDIPRELVEAKRVVILIKREERKQNEKRN